MATTSAVLIRARDDRTPSGTTTCNWILHTCPGTASSPTRRVMALFYRMRCQVTGIRCQGFVRWWERVRLILRNQPLTPDTCYLIPSFAAADVSSTCQHSLS
jgi:hypothetical protein